MSRLLDAAWRATFRVADVVEVVGARGLIILVLVGIVAHACGVRLLQEAGIA